jgi:2-polyprenyl-6-hydroxyphenyl methylase/3-demethylubiquinone-9 3-methyltransferase
MLRHFIDWNRHVSAWQRKMVSYVVPECGPDGPTDFRDSLLPSLLRPGLRVLDVGGGKRPAIALEEKQRLGLHVVGLDISGADLELAPAGAYDRTIVGDIATVPIEGEYDLVFSRAVIEHVENPRGAIDNMSRVLARGGVMAHYVPCRNAPFAVINRALGNQRSSRLLFALFPDKREHSGFPAHYTDCTPAQLVAHCRGAGLDVREVKPYYNSSYASFFVPFHTIDLLRQATLAALRWESLCEGFAIVAQRNNH